MGYDDNESRIIKIIVFSCIKQVEVTIFIAVIGRIHFGRFKTKRHANNTLLSI